MRLIVSLGWFGLLLPVSLFVFQAVEAERQKPSEEDISSGRCAPLSACPLCPLLIEWPLDFDGDDLAETVQHRVCQGGLEEHRIGLATGRLYQQPAYETLVVLNWKKDPVFYQSNQRPFCDKGEGVHFRQLERFDFLGDNFDELLLVEDNQTRQIKTLRVLGYNAEKGVIGDLPLLDFRDQLKPGQLAAEAGPDPAQYPAATLNTGFQSFIGSDGMIIRAEIEDQPPFEVYYFQDATDRVFYPLKVVAKSLEGESLPEKPIDQNTASLFYVDTRLEN